MHHQAGSFKIFQRRNEHTMNKEESIHPKRLKKSRAARFTVQTHI